MVRGVVVLLLILLLAATMVLGLRWAANRPADEPESSSGETCRPLTEDCSWRTDSGTATLTMTPGEGDEMLLELTLPGAAEKPVILLTGESMYMGEYPLLLSGTGESGQYRVRFVPPFCSTGDDMVWRVSLQDRDKTLAPPFRILFSPSEAG
ncbi:MAG: hypothetical protein ACOCVV_01680 [Marinobacter sp.]